MKQLASNIGYGLFIFFGMIFVVLGALTIPVIGGVIAFVIFMLLLGTLFGNDTT